eukprot:5855974-Alexandrium_andersonii.AAC.1
MQHTRELARRSPYSRSDIISRVKQIVQPRPAAGDDAKLTEATQKVHLDESDDAKDALLDPPCDANAVPDGVRLFGIARDRADVCVCA